VVICGGRRQAGGECGVDFGTEAGLGAYSPVGIWSVWPRSLA